MSLRLQFLGHTPFLCSAIMCKYMSNNCKSSPPVNHLKLADVVLVRLVFHRKLLLRAFQFDFVAIREAFCANMPV